MRVRRGETRLPNEMYRHLCLARFAAYQDLVGGQAGKLGNSYLGPKWGMRHAEGRREVGERGRVWGAGGERSTGEGVQNPN